jgi:peptidoglycan/xylan/chitin deacetylase (PgdA/CDA1 family)
MYHGVPARSDGNCVDGKIFEHHVSFLKKYFDLVSLDDLDQRRRPLERIRVALTFDDGFRNNAEIVAPILRKYQVPARFFVCTRHATPGKYLWFSYFSALEKYFRWKSFCFRGETIDMTASLRPESVRRLSETLLNLQPHPAAMYRAIDEELPRVEDFVDRQEIANSYAGMTTEQIAELAADHLFSVGIHTLDHPLLTKCTNEETSRQILDNKTWLAQVCHQECDTIAYPGGDYDSGIVKQCQTLGLSEGYAVIPQTKNRSQLEISRMGVYSPSLEILGFKVQWSHLMRILKIKVG